MVQRQGWPEFSRLLTFRLIPLVGGPTCGATDDTFSFAGKANTFFIHPFVSSLNTPLQPYGYTLRRNEEHLVGY